MPSFLLPPCAALSRRGFLCAVSCSLFTATRSHARLCCNCPVSRRSRAALGLSISVRAVLRRAFGLVANACSRCGTGASGFALVGVPLATPSGSTLHLEAHHTDGAVTQHDLEIGPKAYASQHLKVKPGQVELSADDFARFERERAHLVSGH